MNPIYVPSKGRATTASTPKLLEAVGCAYYLVVEEQEYALYKANYPTASFLILPESHQGVAYVRQWILERVYRAGESWYWMLDDDVKKFYYRVEKQIIPADARVLALSESLLEMYVDVAQVSLHRKEYAWRSTKPYVWNTYCNDVVANNAQLLYPVATYRKDVQEDIDMTLQALAAGYRVLRIEQYFYETPTDGTNKGGLHEEYQNCDDTRWSYNMLDLWGPDIIKLAEENGGRLTARPNWRYFSPRAIRKRLEEACIQSTL